MQGKRHIIYYVGMRNKLYDKLFRLLNHSFEVVYSDECLFHEVSQNKLFLVVLIDYDLHLKQPIDFSLMRLNSSVPFIGVTEAKLIHLSAPHFDSIISLVSNNPTERFDELETYLIRLKRERFGSVHQTSNFRKFIIEQFTKEPHFEKQIISYYQPIYDLSQSRIIAFEALMRWPGMTLPDFHIEELLLNLEDVSILDAITLHQFDEILNFLHYIFLKTGRYYGVYINLSVAQFENPYVIQELSHLIKNSTIPAQFINIEVRATDIFEMDSNWRLNLREIQNIGANISMKFHHGADIDLNDILLLDIDSLKLQQSFIRNIEADQLLSLHKSAAAVNLRLIAEQVENKQDLDFIMKNSINQAQGYLFHRPMLSAHLYQTITNPKDPKPS